MAKDTHEPFDDELFPHELRGEGGGKGAGSPTEAANTLQSNHILRLVEVLGEGPIQGVVETYLNRTKIEEDDGTKNFDGVSSEFRLGTPDQSPLEGYNSQEADTVVDAAVLQATPITRTVTDLETDAVRVVVKLPALYEYEDNGDMNPATVEYAIEYRPDGGSWISAPDSPFRWENEKNTSPVYLAHRFPLTGTGPWDVRMTRVTEDSADNSKLQNQTFFFSIGEIIEQKLTYRNTALWGLTANAQQFGSRIPERAALVDGLICKVPSNYNTDTRVYTGIWDGTWVDAWTDDPAWCLRDILYSNRYGLGRYINAAYLDDTTLYAISQYCSEQVDDGNGGTEPRFTFNAVIQSRQEAYDLVNAMASVFRGMVYWSLGAATFAQDRPADPILNVTRANTLNGDFNYSGSSIKTVHNRVNVTYNEPGSFYSREIVTVDDPEHIRQYGLRPKDIVAFGCTSRAQAIRAGRWLLYTERMEAEICTYTAGPDHVDAVPGSIVRVMDPAVSGVGHGGRLKSYTTNTVTLDRDVTLEASKTYELVVSDEERELHYRTVTTAPGTTDTLTLSVNLPVLDGNPAHTVWALKAQEDADTLQRVLSVREVGRHQYEVACLAHDPSKFALIEGGYDIPAFPLPLLPTGPLPVPKNLRAVEQVATQSGTLNKSTLLVSLTRDTDPRVRGVELQYRRKGDAWITLDLKQNLNHEITGADQGVRYQVRARTYDGAGSYSAYTSIFNVVPDGNPLGTAIPEVTNPQLTAALKSINVSWTNPSLSNFRGVEVWTHTADIPDLANVPTTATLYATSSGTSQLISGLDDLEVTTYVWLRVVTHSVTGEASPFTVAGSTAPAPSDPLTPLEIQNLAEYFESQFLADLQAQIDTNATTIASEVADSALGRAGLADEIVRIDTQYQADIASAVATIGQTYVAAADVAEAIAVARFSLSTSLGLRNLILTPFPLSGATNAVGGWTAFTEDANIPTDAPVGSTSFRVTDTFSYEAPNANGDLNGVTLQFSCAHDLTNAPAGVQVVIQDQDDTVLGNLTIPFAAGWGSTTLTFPEITTTTTSFKIGIRCIGTGETAEIRDLRLWDTANEDDIASEFQSVQSSISDINGTVVATADTLRSTFDPENYILTPEPRVGETDEDGDWNNVTVVNQRPPAMGSWQKSFEVGNTDAYEMPWRRGNLNGRTMRFRGWVYTTGASGGGRFRIRASRPGDANGDTLTTIGTVTFAGNTGWTYIDQTLSFSQDTVRWVPVLSADTPGQTIWVTSLDLDAISGFADAEALVVQEAATRASEIAAEATLREGVQTNLTQFESDVAATYITSASAFSNFRTASQVNSAIAGFNLDLNSDFTSVRDDISDIEGDISSIQANYVTTATLTSQYRTEAGTDTAIAQAITNIDVSFEGSNVNLQTIASALDGVRAEYGAVINNNGVLSGVKLISDIVDGGGVSSTFKVQADKFEIVSNTNTNGAGAKQVFEISGSYARLTSDVLINGSLTVIQNIQRSSLSSAVTTEIETAQSTADSKNRTFRQSSTPSGAIAGDIWINTSTLKILRYSGSVWQAASIEADGVISSWVYTGTLTAAQVNAVAINADSISAGTLNANRIALNGSFLEVGSGGVLQIKDDAIGTDQLQNDAVTNNQLANDIVNDIATGVSDSAQAIIDAGAAQTTADGAQTDATQAIGDAATAQTTADGKNKTFIQFSAPVATAVGDLWIDTSGGFGSYIFKRWSGSSWIEATIQAYEVRSDWVYAGTLSASQVNAVAINAGSITVGVLSATVLNLNGTMFTSNGGALEVADDGIDTAQIANDAITNAQIASNAVTADSLNANAVTADKIAADAVTAAKIDVTNLSAINADLGTITGGSMDIGTSTQGLEVNVSGKANAVYANQNHINNYALYAENHFDNNSFASGAMYIQSHNGYTLQIVQTDNVAGNVAASIQNSQSTGGNVELGCAPATGGYGVEVIRGGYYDTSGDGYAPFTGKHEAYMRANLEAQVEPGDIVCDRIVVARKGVSDAITIVRPCMKVADKTAVGVYASTRPDDAIPAAMADRGEMGTKKGNDFTENDVKKMRKARDKKMLTQRRSNAKLIYMNSLGEGLVNVCGRGGDFEAGDLVVTSDLRGKGQKQDDDVIRSYTVAKVREPVTFAHRDEVKTVACIYLCG